ncbi:MAG: uroporphyrinogen-III synthase [Erythrobacter sp.]|nr:uroporphyrinogen-III synthase [Erythrobacter sp.]NCQ62989.1 uroporphyrinogen-III synthase [Alphaproteobacteria bacterium]
MAPAVFVLRPEPGLAKTMERGHALGLAMQAMPLSSAQPLPWRVPQGDFDGILLGSANALRHAGEQARGLIHLPVYAVGEATATDARAHGFTVAQTGEGGLQALLDSLGSERALSLLRLAGAEHLPLQPPPGVRFATAETYRIMHRQLTGAEAELLAQGGVVLLHSGASARHFRAECERAGINRARLSLAALAPRIAASVSDGWKSVQIAAQPRDEALLFLAADMCH